MKKWGLYDTQDKLWMGGEGGPSQLDDFMLARAAAQVVYMALGWEPTRVVPRELPVTTFTQRDTVDAEMTAEEAIRKLEEGEL